MAFPGKSELDGSLSFLPTLVLGPNLQKFLGKNPNFSIGFPKFIVSPARQITMTVAVWPISTAHITTRDKQYSSSVTKT